MRKNYFLSLFLLMTAFYNVKATDGSKSTSPARNFETSVLAPPATPTGLNGAAVGGIGTRINLAWIDNASDETEFEVAYSTLPSGYTTVYTGVNSLGATGNYQLTGLMPATTYYISVRAIKPSDGTTPTCGTLPVNTPTNPAAMGKTVSCWSNVIIVSTNALIPELVTGVVVATPYSQRTNTIFFNDNSNNETNFVIERSTGGDFVQLAVLGAFAGTGQRSYVDNSTLPNTFYTYRVFARNGTGSALPEARSGTFRTPNDPPTAPFDLATFNIGLNNISVFWKNSSSIVLDFEVERSLDGFNWVKVDTRAANDNLSHNSTGLAEGTRYFFRVKARNEGGFSGYSNVIQPVTLQRVAPDPSFNLTAKTISDTQIDLAWNLGVQNGVTNNRIAQEIYRSSISGTDGYVRLVTLGDYEATYSDKTALPKTRYWYKIFSVNLQGQSPFSNVAVATTLGPPFVPSDLAAVLANDALGNAVIRVTWKDNSADEVSFTLEKAIDADFTKELLTAKLDSNTVAATSIPIEEGLTFYYRVKASNRFGDSKYSNVAQVVTIVTAAPNAPYALKATATAAEVALKWGDDSNKEAAFDIERSDDGKVFAKIGTTGRNEIVYSDKTVREKTKYFYRVRATNIRGNSEYSNVVEVTTPARVSASIGLSADESFVVYPNPTVDGVKVTIPENMLKESGIVIITDRMNREVLRTVLNKNQSEYRFDLSNYSEGTYTISIRTDTQQLIKRVYKY